MCSLERVKEAATHPEKDLLSRRFERSYLRIGDEHLRQLPIVRAVTQLDIPMAHPRLLWPASSAIISSKLTRLQSVEIRLCDNDQRDRALRKQNRTGKLCGSVIGPLVNLLSRFCPPFHALAFVSQGVLPGILE